MNKRVHEIAKERGLPAKDVLAQLKAAGVNVKSASSSVDEAAALRVLGNGGGPSHAGEPLASQGGGGGGGDASGGTGSREGARARRPGAPRPRPGGQRRDRAQDTAPAPRAQDGDSAPPAAAADSGQPAASPAGGGVPAGDGGPRGVAVAATAPTSAPPATRSRASARRARRRPATRRDRLAGLAPRARRRRPAAVQPAAAPPASRTAAPRRLRRRGRVASGASRTAVAEPDAIQINSGSTVKDVAEYLDVSSAEIMKKLMALGEMKTLTQTLSDEAIVVLAEKLGKTVDIVHTEDETVSEPVFHDADEDLVERAPVVTIMGHVDHGKTSLLDAIRETEVAAGEAGGITQHIGAYQVHHGDRTVTFLDTPGHEAFTAMRARGAKGADIAVIVVAADDGVKPQTQEAVDHAKEAGVPMLVAVNKIDKEGADPDRVRTEMTNLGLQPVEWGGDTEFVDVSAKTREGLDDLLDTITTMAELEELRANPDAPASGTVIESKLDPGRGPVVTILISAARSRSATRSSPAPTGGACARCTTSSATASRRRCPASRSRCSASTACPRPASASASSSTSAARGSSRASARPG